MAYLGKVCHLPVSTVLMVANVKITKINDNTTADFVLPDRRTSSKNLGSMLGKQFAFLEKSWHSDCRTSSHRLSPIKYSKHGLLSMWSALTLCFHWLQTLLFAVRAVHWFICCFSISLTKEHHIYFVIYLECSHKDRFCFLFLHCPATSLYYLSNHKVLVITFKGWLQLIPTLPTTVNYQEISSFFTLPRLISSSPNCTVLKMPLVLSPMIFWYQLRTSCKFFFSS